MKNFFVYIYLPFKDNFSQKNMYKITLNVQLKKVKY